MMNKRLLNKIENEPFITWLLLSLMVIVYVVMSLSGGSTNPRVLLEFGAEYNPFIADGQWWRLFTPIFIHIGFEHILLNGLTIYFLGVLIEPILGHVRYLIVFLLSGFCGNVLSFSFGSGVSAGASTSIFGMFGAFLAIALIINKNQFIEMTAKTFIVFVLINLLTDLFMPGIDIWGHIGGFVGGFILTMITGIKKNKSLNIFIKLFYANALFIVIIVLYYIGLKRL